MSLAQQSTTLNIKALQLTLAKQVEQIKQGYTKLSSMQAEQDQAHTRCYVCLYGGTNTGKSSLFNLILGTEVSVAKATASATKSAVVSIPQRLADLSEPCPKDLWLKHCVPLQTPNDPLQAPKIDPQLKVGQQSNKTVAYLHIHTQDNKLYQNLDPEQCLVLIDTPDHDSHKLEHQQNARAILPHCELCIYVTSAQKYKHQSTISELLYILYQGLKVGVVFNMLDAHQDLDLIWQDLQEQLAKAVEDEASTEAEKNESKQAQAQPSLPSPNNITLLGALPVVHGLKQAVESEKQEISQAIFKALSSLFGNSTPYQYMQKKAQEQSRAQLYALQRLLEQAQDTEAQVLQKYRQAFKKALTQELSQANLLNQIQLEERLSHLVTLHYLSKICSHTYLLRLPRYLQDMQIKYREKFNQNFNFDSLIHQSHHYLLRLISYVWHKTMGSNEESLSHSAWSNIAQELDIDLSTLHLETSLLPKLNQEVNTWSLRNGEAFVRAFTATQHQELGHNTDSQRSLEMPATHSALTSVATLVPQNLKPHELSNTQHDLICFVFTLMLLPLGLGLFGIVLGIILCSLAQMLVLSILCLRDLELKPDLSLNLQAFYRELVQNQADSREHKQIWWQAFKNQLTASIELQDLSQKLNVIAQKLGK